MRVGHSSIARDDSDADAQAPRARRCKIAAAGRPVREAVTPADDTRGSIRQRKQLAAVYTERALRGATERAGRKDLLP